MQPFTTKVEALAWLRNLGGSLDGPTPYAEDYDKIMVSLGLNSRNGLIENHLTGDSYDAAADVAIIMACNELRHRIGVA